MFKHNSVCMHLEVFCVLCMGKYASGRDYVSQGLCNTGILVPKKIRKLKKLYHPHHMIHSYVYHFNN